MFCLLLEKGHNVKSKQIGLFQQGLDGNAEQQLILKTMSSQLFSVKNIVERRKYVGEKSSNHHRI